MPDWMVPEYLTQVLKDLILSLELRSWKQAMAITFAVCTWKFKAIHISLVAKGMQLRNTTLSF